MFSRTDGGVKNKGRDTVQSSQAKGRKQCLTVRGSSAKAKKE